MLVPEVEEVLVCVHGYSFSASNKNLVRESQNMILYTEQNEKVFDIPVFSRRSSGPCKCLQRLDGTKYLIWNLGQGRFIDFPVLYSYLQKWVNSGIKIYAMWKSIYNSAMSSGISCTLKYDDLHRSICGFMNNLDIDFQRAYQCPTHGTSPKWVVADGKNVGPLSRRVNHLKELDVDHSDTRILRQSTKFQDRTFLKNKKERMIICQLLTGELPMNDFLEISEIRSEEGILLVELVRHIIQSNPDEMPSCYKNFIGNVSKPTSVRSLLQVLSPEPLQYLDQFCKEELSLFSHTAQRQLKCVASSLPAVWPDLEKICITENSEYLPKPVTDIIFNLLKIRAATFENATKRTNSDYVMWADPTEEHPTQCYPALPLWRHPSNYNVSSVASSELCDKTFITHNTFSAGIFSIGCACDKNITLGFELMLEKEGPKNLFRILQCRDIDMDSLEGILIDHACRVEPYILNREAEMLKWKLLLVDGSHWNGMKKLRKPDRSGKNGHIGCSTSFNFNIYKEHLKTKPNSQGREQLHALVEKCTDSLRLMNYRHFMIFMRIFFAIKNLEQRNYE